MVHIQRAIRRRPIGWEGLAFEKDTVLQLDMLHLGDYTKSVLESYTLISREPFEDRNKNIEKMWYYAYEATLPKSHCDLLYGKVCGEIANHVENTLTAELEIMVYRSASDYIHGMAMKFVAEFWLDFDKRLHMIGNVLLLVVGFLYILTTHGGLSLIPEMRRKKDLRVWNSLHKRARIQCNPREPGDHRRWTLAADDY